ncbi:MAG: PKD domain-containing protein [Bacteroidia bacterium]|jgi:PKD repeat protein
MNPKNPNMFDELVRQKLEGYSEPPDMELLQTIHSRKSRLLKWYGLYRILIITTTAGLAMLGLYFGMSVHTPETATQPQQELNQSISATSEFAATHSNSFQHANQPTASSASNYAGVSSIATQASITLQTAGFKHQSKKPAPRTNAAFDQKTQANSTSVLIPVKSTSDKEKVNKSESKPELSNDCDVAFDYFTSYSGQLEFTNFSVAENIRGYRWEFGDGHYSLSSSPAHTYAKPGDYTVQLTLEAEGCSKSITRQVRVQNPEQQKNIPSSLMGVVRAGNDPVEGALVELIAADNNAEGAIQYVARTNKNGEFQVNNLQAGRFILVAHPQADQTEYRKTYWGNESLMELAPEIIITNTQNETLSGYSIDLIYQASISSQPPVAPIASSNSRQVILFDQYNNIVGYGTVNENGEITYDGNLNGNYKVIDRESGAIKGSVNLGSTPAQPVSKGLLEAPTTPPVKSIILNPNPASSFVNVNLQDAEGNISSVLVMDANGKEMMRTHGVSEGLNKIPLDISNLPAGVYYVVVMMKDGTLSSTRLLKSDVLSNPSDR